MTQDIGDSTLDQFTTNVLNRMSQMGVSPSNLKVRKIKILLLFFLFGSYMNPIEFVVIFLTKVDNATLGGERATKCLYANPVCN
jgi:hypothetical protein